MDYMAGGGDVLQAAPAPGPSSRHYSARCGGGDEEEEEEEEEYVEIILDRRHGSMAGHGAEPAPGGGGGDNDDDDSEEVTVPAQALENSSGIDRSDPATARVLKALDFIRGIGGEVATAEKFFDELSQDGRLHRSEFGQCIGTEEVELAGELFDALANRRTISCDSSISKAELLVFCDQISHQRLWIFFDMVGKNTGVRITEEEVKQIILLRPIRPSPANEQSTRIEEQAEEQARWIMEDLDPNNLGHIELDNLEMELLQARIQSEGIGMTTDRRLRPTWEPNPLRRWCRPTLYFLEDNWRRVWVILLWLAVYGGLFAWKFVQYRRRAVFEVMGYCVCVGKGGAETLKFNMALVLLPFCRNTITWVRDCAAVARVVPLDDSLSFHKVISVGVAVGAGLHITSQMACNFPRLLHATDAVYAPVAQFYGTPRPPNYWWFLKGTEGWTGIVMVVLMSVAFTLATPWFRRARIRLPGPLRRQLAGFNAFWYTHHLFVVVYALLILHGHSLYLSNKWYKKTTWMYLAVPMLLYSCERLTRVLRSSVRPVKVLKVAVYPGNVMVLCFSKPRGFRYKSGQYILLNCATVSAFQWHPFYLTSAPQDDYLSVHIRTLGDWTRQLRSVFSLVLRPPTDGKSGLLPFDHDGGAMSNQSYPKVLIDGPYGAPGQDYKKYDIGLLVGLGIDVTPMISIIKDIINNIKQLKGDLESGSGGDEIGNSTSSFRMQRVYFYWVTREQGSFEWFRDVMDDVAETDKGIIDVQVYCTNEYTKEGKHSALTLMLQSLSHAKHGFVSGTRVTTHFARPNWRNIFKRIAVNHGEQHVGVFYCGAPALEQEMRELAQDFSRKTSTKFEFHKENF